MIGWLRRQESLQVFVSVKNCVLVCAWHFSLCPHVMKRSKQLSGDSFIRALLSLGCKGAPHPHRLVCLNTWSPAGGAVPLGGGALLDEVSLWREGLRFDWHTLPLPTHSLLPDCEWKVPSTSSSCPAIHNMMEHTSWICQSKQTLSAFSCFLLGIHSEQ